MSRGPQSIQGCGWTLPATSHVHHSPTTGELDILRILQALWSQNVKVNDIVLCGHQPAAVLGASGEICFKGTAAAVMINHQVRGCHVPRCGRRGSSAVSRPERAFAQWSPVLRRWPCITCAAHIRPSRDTFQVSAHTGAHAACQNRCVCADGSLRRRWR